MPAAYPELVLTLVGVQGGDFQGGGGASKSSSSELTLSKIELPSKYIQILNLETAMGGVTVPTQFVVLAKVKLERGWEGWWYGYTLPNWALAGIALFLYHNNPPKFP